MPRQICIDFIPAAFLSIIESILQPFLIFRTGFALKTGIFGGTFNPIHMGHLINAQIILELFHLDRILFIPVKSPVHKPDDPGVKAHHRLEMIMLAISGNPSFEVSGIEIDRPAPSYMITTVRELKRAFPGDEFSVIIGSDSYRELDTWKDYEELLEEAVFIVMGRRGDDPDTGKYGSKSARFQFADNPFIEISSSFVRERVRGGQTIRHIVPDAVMNYILDKRLYVS